MNLDNHKPELLSIIIPIYNEEGNISELYNRLKKTIKPLKINYEIIFINDGSTDNSLLEIDKINDLDENIFFINLSRNFGHQVAITAGIEKCNGDIAVLIDGDLQDPPELIEELYNTYKKGYNVVYAKRKKRHGETILKKITAKLFYKLLKKITVINIPIDTGDFRLIDRLIIDHLKRMPEKNKFIRGQIAWLGFKQTYVIYNREKRKYGNSGYTFSKMLELALSAITGFSDKPLRLVSKLGFLISLISFFIILYAIYSHFILQRTITGWTSLIISSMFIGGIQLFSIGVIGEYISRINKNSDDRPLYIIEDTNL